MNAISKVARLIIAVMAAAFFTAGLAACDGNGEEAAETPTATEVVTATAQPSPAPEGETPETAVTPEGTAAAEPTVAPSPEAEDEYAGWLTYTNDVYGYEFRYPPGAEITVFPEDVQFCVSVNYGPGHVSIEGEREEEEEYGPCLGGGIGLCGPPEDTLTIDREETLLIDGRTYTAGGIERRCPGETLNDDLEAMNVFLEAGTAVEPLEFGTAIAYGTRPSETATFEDYLQIRDDIIKIVQSYRKLP